jgi:hypothetical protein
MNRKLHTHTDLVNPSGNSFATRTLHVNTKHAYKDGTMKHTSNTHRRVLGIIAAVCCIVAMPSMVSAAGKPSKGQVYACVNAQTGDLLRVLPDETGRCAKKEHLVMMYPTTNSASGSIAGPTTTILANPTTTVAPLVIAQTGFVLLPGGTLTLQGPSAAGDLLASIRADLNATGPSTIVLRITNKGPGRVAGPALAVIVVPQSVKTTNCTNSVWSSVSTDIYAPVAVSQQYGGPVASCKVPVSLNLDSGQSFDVPFNISSWGTSVPTSVVVGGGIFRSEASAAVAIDTASANNVITPTLADVDSNGIETFANSNVDGHLRLTVTRATGSFCCRISHGITLENVGSQILKGPVTITYTVNTGPAPRIGSQNGCVSSTDATLIFNGYVNGNVCTGTLYKFVGNTQVLDRPGRYPLQAYIEPISVYTQDFFHSATVTANVGDSTVSVTIAGARTLGQFSEVSEN